MSAVCGGSCQSHDDDDNVCLTSLLISVVNDYERQQSLSEQNYLQTSASVELTQTRHSHSSEWRVTSLQIVVLSVQSFYYMRDYIHFYIHYIHYIHSVDSQPQIQQSTFAGDSPSHDVAGPSLPPPHVWMSRLCRWSSLAAVLLFFVYRFSSSH